MLPKQTKESVRGGGGEGLNLEILNSSGSSEKKFRIRRLSYLGRGGFRRRLSHPPSIVILKCKIWNIFACTTPDFDFLHFKMDEQLLISHLIYLFYFQNIFIILSTNRNLFKFVQNSSLCFDFMLCLISFFLCLILVWY